MEIGDELIERYYYGSQYLLASCSRNRAFPPSLYGNWTTLDGPSWQADYHLTEQLSDAGIAADLFPRDDDGE